MMLCCRGAIMRVLHAVRVRRDMLAMHLLPLHARMRSLMPRARRAVRVRLCGPGNDGGRLILPYQQHFR